MPFTKGDKNINRQGRPAGKPNKSTDDLRDMVYKFLEKNFATIQAEFNSMESKDKLLFMDRMLRHVLPGPQDELYKLSNEDLDRIIEKLKNEHLRIVK